jgi:hypothetical protein
VLLDRDVEKTGLYNDFFRPNDMYYSTGVKVPLGDFLTVYISCMGTQSKGPFAKARGLVYETLLPQARGLMQELVQVWKQLDKIRRGKKSSPYRHASR